MHNNRISPKVILHLLSIPHNADIFQNEAKSDQEPISVVIRSWLCPMLQYFSSVNSIEAVTLYDENTEAMMAEKK